MESPTRIVFSLTYLELGGATGYRVDALETTWFFDDGSTASRELGPADFASAGGNDRVGPNGVQEFSMAADDSAVDRVEYTTRITDDLGSTRTLTGVAEPTPRQE